MSFRNVATLSSFVYIFFGIVQCFKNVASLMRSIRSESSSFLMIHVFDLVLILER